jgi:hypothetical protein
MNGVMLFAVSECDTEDGRASSISEAKDNHKHIKLHLLDTTSSDQQTLESNIPMPSPANRNADILD